MPQQLCKICSQWLPRGQPNWEKHNLSDNHQKALRAAAQKKKMIEKDVFVTGFNRCRNFTMERLLTEFGKFGEIANHFSGNRAKSFVIIQFKNRESAVKALKTPVFLENNRSLTVRPRIDRNGHNEESKPTLFDPSALHVPPEGTWEDQAIHLCKLLEIPECPVPVSENHWLRVVCACVHQVLSQQFPNCVLHVFGSRATGIAGPDSDVDIFVDLSQDTYHLSPEKQKLQATDPKKNTHEMFNHCVNLMKRSYKFSHVIGVSQARIPVIKCAHKDSNWQCDIIFKNPLSVSNTDLLKYCFELDIRVKLFMVVIKHWFRGLDIEQLSTYSLSMMALFYLMTLEKPVLPLVLDMLKAVEEPYLVDGWQANFIKLPFKSENEQTLHELICGFFEFLATYEFGANVMCVLNGQSVPKWRFLSVDTLPEEQYALKEVMKKDQPLAVKLPVCVQDPFETNHNTSKAFNLTKFMEFQNRVKCALEYCKSPESSIQGLFETKPKPIIWTPTTPNILNIYMIKFFPSEVTGSIIDMWWERSELVIYDVFKHILQFEEIDPIPPDEIPKLENSPASWEFRSKFCLWASRKKGKNASTQCKEPNKIPFLREVDISLTLMKMMNINAEILPYCNHITCVVKRKAAPARLEVEIVDNKSSKNMIQSIFLFLTSHLQDLVDKGLAQDYREDLEKLLTRNFELNSQPPKPTLQHISHPSSSTSNAQSELMKSIEKIQNSEPERIDSENQPKPIEIIDIDFDDVNETAGTTNESEVSEKTGSENQPKPIEIIDIEVDDINETAGTTNQQLSESEVSEKTGSENQPKTTEIIDIDIDDVNETSGTTNQQLSDSEVSKKTGSENQLKPMETIDIEVANINETAVAEENMVT